MVNPPEFTRQQRLIINVFLKERTVPRTVKALGVLTGVPYKTQSYVRKIVRMYRVSSVASIEVQD